MAPFVPDLFPTVEEISFPQEELEFEIGARAPRMSVLRHLSKSSWRDTMFYHQENFQFHQKWSPVQIKEVVNFERNWLGE